MMIKLDYKLIRDEYDELRTYTPQKHLTNFSDLVYIKGPNGSGKSAILHIIALALYGNYLSSDELDPGLKRKIENLLDLDHNQLTFDLEISNPVVGFTLKSQKRDPKTKDIEVSVIRDGKKSFYPKEKFNKEFRLLYTIPNNPTTQLPQLLSEVKVSQLEIGTRIAVFRNFLQEKIVKLEKSRDDVTLFRAKKDYDQTQDHFSSIEDKLFTQKADYEKLLKYLNVKVYLDSATEISSINEKIATIDSEINSLGKITGRKIRVQKSEEKKFGQTMETIEKEKDKLMIVLARYLYGADLELRYDQISSSSVIVEIKKSAVQKTIRENLKIFIKIVDNLVESENIAHSTELKSFDLYKSLLEVLSNPKYFNLSVPGTEGNVKLLIEHIETALYDINKIQKKLDSYVSDSYAIRGFLKKLEDAISYRQNNPISSEEIESANEIRVNNLNRDKNSLNILRKKFEEKRFKAREKIIELNEDPKYAIQFEQELENDFFVKKFKDNPEEKIRSYLAQKNQEIYNEESKLHEARRLLQSKKKIISDLEKQEVDPDRVFLPYLKNLDSKIRPLENKFRVQFDKSLEKIQERKKSLHLLEFDKNYSDQIGKYYAKKMKKILYAEEEHEVESVDVVNELITTKSGKKIKFDELSTGQSQSSYLTTKLGMTDTKMTIALFDEVAMMDKKSLDPVVNLLKTNYQKGKLLSSIIVQRDEKSQVEEL